ncbi:MAG: DUF1592 domain-containing protein [Deltaproteobacteria bacterium]|nr:DUF1592 domain-containing protein [Deltaproteobacteria bacterium]
MIFSPARRLNIALAVLLAPTALACTGTVSPLGRGPDAGISGTGGSVVGSGGTGTANGGAGAGNVVVPGAGGAGMGTGGSTVVVIPPEMVPESAGPMVLRRLTYRELDHTLRDLLGDTTSVTESWPPDTETNTKFEAPTDFSESIVTRVEESAISVADRALADNRLTPQIPCTNPAAGTAETTCARDFVTRFGRKAYRRPLSAPEIADLMTVFTYARSATIGYDFRTSITQVVKAMLQSPNFLYHWELGPTKPVRQGTLVSLTPHQVASRLSYLLWESMPDEALLAAADAGMLSTPEQVAAQATRLLAAANKVRAADAMYSFHKQWLVYPNLDSVAKSPSYTAFTDAFRAALQPEITAFVSSVLLDGDGTLKTLFTAPYAFVNEATAPAYGVTAAGPALRRVELDPTQRAGILTQAAFLTTTGSPSTSDPIRRGLIILERALCGHADSPPPNFVIPDVPPKGGNIVTTRQQYAAHDTMPCAFCHKDFDPLGFAFENYDAIGSFRTTEGGQPVDATGSGATPVSKTPFMFSNAVGLANFLATNEEVRTCVARQWFRYFSGRMEVQADTGSIQQVVKQANANVNFSIRDMLVGIAKSTSFRYRVQSAGEPTI